MNLKSFSVLWIQTTAAVAPITPERTNWTWITSAGTTSAAAHRVQCVYECVNVCVHARCLCVSHVYHGLCFLFFTPGDCCISKSETENFPSKERETFACKGLHHGTAHTCTHTHARLHVHIHMHTGD